MRRRETRGRFERRVLITAGVCTTVTLLTMSAAPVHFAYAFPGATPFFTAIASMSALSVAALFYVRHTRSREFGDLLIAFVFGITAILEALLPMLAAVDPDALSLDFWSRLTARAVVAAGLAVAATLRLNFRFPRISPRVMVAATAAGAAVVVVTTLVRISTLPDAVTDATGSADAFAGTPTRVVRVVGAVLLFAAAAGFVRRARARNDEMLVWLAVGALLLGTARFHDFLYPSLHSDWIATSDLLRISGQLVLVSAAIGELAAYWHRRAREARDRERRRLAAELHDGLAQELAYLRTQSALAASEGGNATQLLAISESAERALEQARLAITEWTRDGPASLDALLAELARDVELRHGCRVRLALESVAVEARLAHELSRVASEAMLNAARHSGTDTITVRLSTRAGVVRLHVSDDGTGLKPRRLPRAGFGLTAMRERTERLGGQCRIESAPQHGTVVAVEVPRR